MAKMKPNLVPSHSSLQSNVIVQASNQINAKIAARKEAIAKAKKEEYELAIAPWKDTYVENVILLLGNSPVDLNKSNIGKIQTLFPVPKEQYIFWADAEFDLRPSGIVCTDMGVYIKTDISVWQNKRKQNDEAEKSVLYYYPWTSFETAWFTENSVAHNTALLVNSNCSSLFVEVCRLLTADQEKHTQDNGIEFLFSDLHKDQIAAEAAVTSSSAVQASQKAVFVEHKSALNTTAGHGEMAEEAITMLDRLNGLDAKVIGRDNAKDGADRLIGPDLFIQTKYHKSARSTLESCFRHDSGMYRYMNGDTPMQLEVPKDQYERVLKDFERKIESGKVPGVTDPKEASNIVRKGRLTYQQAVNLTKPGTIESLAYDALTGVVTCSFAFGLSFVASAFLTWRKTGDITESIQAGVAAGIQVFGLSFIQHMAVQQVARTGLANSLMAPSQFVVEKLGSHTSATIVNGIRTLSGKSAIHGAAASKHLAKILRSNVLTSAITFAAFSVPETYNLATKKISAAQYTKNLSVLAGSIAGGAGGAIAAGIASAKIGSVTGTAIAPGVGTAIGLAGGFFGGAVSAKAVGVVGNVLHEDDVVIWSRLFNAYVSCMINEYMLDSEEMDSLVKRMNLINQKDFKTLFETLQKSDSQEAIVRNFLEPHFDAVVAERDVFELPGVELILDGLFED